MEILIAIGIGVLIVLHLAKRGESRVDEQAQKQIGELKEQLKQERSEKDELSGKGKQLFNSYKDLEADHKALTLERDSLHKRVVQYEESEERRKKELDEQLQKLHRAEKSLEDEKARVRREDEERKQKALEERDRIWNDHEQNILALLFDLCKKPDTAFPAFDNSNLPEEFDGSIKPDFMIQFLNQYVVFDAKVSRSENFQNYITTNVKKTAEKYKGKEFIYPTVFFVVPTDAISELKRRTFTENGMTFHIVSPEALAPILASFKKITSYEFAEKMDPQERENIIHLVASLDHHISMRNAFDVVMAQQGSAVLYDAKKIAPGIVDEVELEKGKMRVSKFKDADIKRLMNADERSKEVEELTSPKAEVDSDVIEEMQEVF